MIKRVLTALSVLVLSSYVCAQDRFVNYLMNSTDYATNHILNSASRAPHQKSQLKTSQDLQKFGITYFQLTKLSTASVAFRLLDDASATIATVEMQKKKGVTGDIALYTIQGDRKADDAWIRVISQETNTSGFYQTITSSGQTSSLRVQFAPLEERDSGLSNRNAIQSISTFTNGKWRSRSIPTLAELQQIRSRGGSHPFGEELRLLSNRPLRL